LRLFSGSFEHALDVKMRVRSKSPSPRLGRVRVGLRLKNDFLPDSKVFRNSVTRVSAKARTGRLLKRTGIGRMEEL